MTRRIAAVACRNGDFDRKLYHALIASKCAAEAKANGNHPVVVEPPDDEALAAVHLGLTRVVRSGRLGFWANATKGEDDT